jgi:methyltransferase (TIGR00027 family)
MAAARARESERPYRLFDDPLAAALAGPEGFAWLERMEPVPRFGGPALYVVVRTRFFDDFLLYACWGAGVRQVVLLAAGMDARAFRLNWPPGTRLYELDRPEVLAAKEEVIARRCPTGLRAAGHQGGLGPPFLVGGALERRL